MKVKELMRHWDVEPDLIEVHDGERREMFVFYDGTDSRRADELGDVYMSFLEKYGKREMSDFRIVEGMILILELEDVKE
jgi:hypothetical protein